MDPTLAAIISGILVYGGGKVIDHWLGRGKAKTDERASERTAAFNELKEVWARNDKLEEAIDKCKGEYLAELAKNKDFEFRIAYLTQRLTAAKAKLELYERPPHQKIVPPPNQETHTDDTTA